jgi:hypothetical protein
MDVQLGLSDYTLKQRVEQCGGFALGCFSRLRDSLVAAPAWKQPALSDALSLSKGAVEGPVLDGSRKQRAAQHRPFHDGAA